MRLPISRSISLGLGALAILVILPSPGAGAASMNEPPLNSPLTDERPLPPLAERLRTHVQALAGEIGQRNVFRPRALHAAADYIRTEWHAQGHRVREQVYVANDVRCENLEVELHGGERATEIILAGAHYDSVDGSPGADDNASGVAALLEIGRALAGQEFRRTVRLVAFVNEEPPFFYWGEMGSGVYAKAARKRGDDIRVMMSLEMLGTYTNAPDSQRYPPIIGWFYPNRGNYIAFVSNLRSRSQLRRTVRAFRAHTNFPSEYLATFEFVPGVSWSDQLSFWREDYPAIMVTDTAFYRNPWYHTLEDTPDKLNYDSMAQVVSGLANAIRALANDQGDL